MKIKLRIILVAFLVIAMPISILCFRFYFTDIKDDRGRDRKLLEDKHLNMNASFELTGQELRKLEESADAGNAEAAFKLYQHYAIFVRDNALAFKWVSLAAKLGDATSANNLAVMYLQSPTSPDFKQARYWVTVAKNNGIKSARTLLDEIDFKEKQSRK